MIIIKLKLRVDEEGSDCAAFHPETVKKLRLNNPQKKLLRFGIQSHKMNIHASSALGLDEAEFSLAIIKKLKIPLSPFYEFLVKNNEIWIGPYFGFLAARRLKTLEDHISTLSDYVHHYQDIGGAVLAFTLEGVNPSERTIRGYLYNRHTQKWDKGTYAYPASVFIRGHVANDDWFRHFKSAAGNTLFNDFYFDKWEMHKLLWSKPEMKKHLPVTIFYTKPADVLSFLDFFPHAYIKPIHGTMGVSILKASKTGREYCICYRQNGRNMDARFADPVQTESFLGSVLDERKYIIQRDVGLMTDQNKIIDFRLIVVKNEFGEWEFMGMIAKCGAPGSIISNISAEGTAEAGEIVLKKIFHLSDTEVEQMKNRMALLAMNAVRSIEATGVHFANTGVDIGIDREKNLWIIEVQHHSPAHSITLDAGNVEMYKRILRKNMLYLKRLAGFSANDDKRSIFKGEFV